MYDALGRTTLQTNQDNTTEMWIWSGNIVSFRLRSRQYGGHAHG